MKLCGPEAAAGATPPSVDQTRYYTKLLPQFIQYSLPERQTARRRIDFHNDNFACYTYIKQ